MWKTLEVCVIKMYGQFLTIEIKYSAKKKKREKKKKILFKTILPGIISIVYLKNLVVLFCYYVA